MMIGSGGKKGMLPPIVLVFDRIEQGSAGNSGADVGLNNEPVLLAVGDADRELIKECLPGDPIPHAAEMDTDIDIVGYFKDTDMVVEEEEEDADGHGASIKEETTRFDLPNMVVRFEDGGNATATESETSSRTSRCDTSGAQKDFILPNLDEFAQLLSGCSSSTQSSEGTHSTCADLKHEESGEDSIQCNLCGSKFSLKYNLTKHIKNVHQKHRPFRCTHCPMRFQQRNHMVKHIATVHENSRPYKCDHCDATFGWIGVLRKHVALVHEKKRPHECNICHKSFQQKIHLTNHMRAVHLKERPFSCEICGCSFSRKEILVRHHKRKHAHDSDQALAGSETLRV